MTVPETQLIKKAAALKKQLLRKCKPLCQSSYSEEVWRSSFSENKAALKMSLSMLEGKSLFETNSQIKLQARTKYLRKALAFIWNSAPREKFNFYFQVVFS